MKHQKLFEAAMSRFKADRDEAAAQLDLYLNNSVAVGEHPRLVDDIVTLTRQLTEAEDNLNTLRTINHFDERKTRNHDPN
jgi:hypothetical protein